MRCSDNCGYYWQDENDDHPRCHFDNWNQIGKAPCEQEDFEFEDYI